MKKLMFVAVAALCGSLFAEGEITSANIVGYNTVTTEEAKAFPSVSACFVPVDGATSYKLKDFKPTGMYGSNNDMIQTLNPATTVQNGQYIYVSLAECRAIADDGTMDYLAGWWKGEIGGESANEEPITVGTAFLGMIYTENASISFQSSGEAPTYTTKFTTDGSAFPFFGNFLPKDIKLKDIVPNGMSGSNNDMIQTLNPATTVQNGQYIYVSLAECRAIADDGTMDYLAGWWKGEIGGESANEEPVPAGTAFLGMMYSTDPIEFNFPSVLDD